MRFLLAAFARNTVFANILLALIVLAGGMAVQRMVREIFPEFSLDAIVIQVPYPGADPAEVEEGVCRRIEEAISSIQGIKQYDTIAAEGLGWSWIEVHPSYETRDVLDKVRSQVDGISSFPVNAERPITSEYTLRDPVLLVCLSGTMSEQRLKTWARRVKDDILRAQGISQVEISGVRDNEVAIEVSETQLRRFGLSLAQVADAVRRSNLNLPGGTLRTVGEEIRIRTLGRKYRGDEFAGIVLLADEQGTVITLDQVATIRDEFVEDPGWARLDGERVVFVTVYKTSEEDAMEISAAVKTYLEEQAPQVPQGAQMNVLYDIADTLLRARIRLLVKNGLIGLTFVFLVLWLFLDIRLSFWAGMGMPISVAGAVVILWAIGGTINMISLFAVIMVLGIVVDDAIVVGEAIYVHRQMGKSPLRAAVDGVTEVGMPVLAAVTTSVVAFLPLMFIGGIMGKFIRILPVVVIACLAVSLVECLLMLPAHLSHLPDPDRVASTTGRWRRSIQAIHRWTNRGLERFIDRIYVPFLRRSLHWNYVLLCTAVAILMITLGVIRGGLIKFEVFPSLDGFVLTSNLTFPAGTPAEVTEEALVQLEAAIRRVADGFETYTKEPMLERVVTTLGSTFDQTTTAFGAHVGSVQAILLAPERRGVHSEKIKYAWEREVGDIPGVQSLTFAGMSAGPPGAPIEVWFQGEALPALLSASDELMEWLRQVDGVRQIRTDFSAGKREIRLGLKPEARTLGLTVQDLASQIYGGYYGEEAVRIQRGRDDIRVKIRYPEEERRRVSDLEAIRIRTLDGREVPLRAVATVDYAHGFFEITRTDGLRRVKVSADVDTARANAAEILAELTRDLIPALVRTHVGVRVSVQGEQKKMRESFDSLRIGFPLALVGIFVIVATIFRSYLQPLVILVTVPFGFIGAVWGHLLLGFDLSIMSVFGMVALTGVVVNDAIVLIEAYNVRMAEGNDFFDAIIAAGRRRFRAVVLTSLSTVGGLMPMILEQDLQARFLIPMALSLAAGVAFATVLTLVLIPSLLAILNDVRRAAHRLRTGAWPTHEEVEPARSRYTDRLDEPNTTDHPAGREVL